jgi:glycosyltransferase involved in cell wall biosynthesis
MPAEPAISVVISTFDRPAALQRLLEALASQRLPGDAQSEVVVVDDGSGPPTGELLESWRMRGAQRPFSLTALRHAARRGPAAGRNSGWRAASGRLVAFTDDDCLPTPGWLAALLQAAEVDPRGFVQGRTLPEPGHLDPRALLVRTQQITRLGPWFETCNIAYPRRALVELGGFDEALGMGGEDTELAWRALAAGWHAVWAPEALVHHAVTATGMARAVRIATRWGPLAGVVGRHPQLRHALFRGVFLNVWHYLWWRSLLLLAPWVRRALPAPLRAALLWRHLRELRARAGRGGVRGAGQLWAVPFLLVHDSVECLTVARAAVRHRTALL